MDNGPDPRHYLDNVIFPVSRQLGLACSLYSTPVSRVAVWLCVCVCVRSCPKQARMLKGPTFIKPVSSIVPNSYTKGIWLPQDDRAGDESTTKIVEAATTYGSKLLHLYGFRPFHRFHILDEFPRRFRKLGNIWPIQRRFYWQQRSTVRQLILITRGIALAPLNPDRDIP